VEAGYKSSCVSGSFPQTIMFSLSFKFTAVIALVAASSVTATPARRQTCSPQFTPGTGYDIQSSINGMSYSVFANAYMNQCRSSDTFIWLFNGASAGSPSAVHLVRKQSSTSPCHLAHAKFPLGSNPPRYPTLVFYRDCHRRMDHLVRRISPYYAMSSLN
jgi:hypothetical protein